MKVISLVTTGWIVVGWLFIFLAFGFVGCSIFETPTIAYLQYGDLMFNWVSFIGACATWAAGVISWRLGYRKWLDKRSKHFQEFFGLAGLEIGDWKDRKLVQPLINRRLTELAKEFKESCSQEEKLIKTCSKVKPSLQSAEIAEQLAQLQTIRTKVEATKERFWQAHGLAQAFGLVAKPSFKDYLPA